VNTTLPGFPETKKNYVKVKKEKPASSRPGVARATFSSSKSKANGKHCSLYPDSE
jgi:hypothetical protein